MVRTRTTVSQAHSYQWLGSFGSRGNGRYQEELRTGLSAIGRYLTTHHLPQERTLLHIFGQYGTGAVLSDVAGFAFVTRGKDYHLLDHSLIQARLHLPPDQLKPRPESQMMRSLYDCPQIPVGSQGTPYRVVVATHPADKKKSPAGVTRSGVVYELFFTNLPQHAFTACDVVELYLHRGAFEPALSDEDQEIDPDRWCSHSAWGQECWQLIAQWVWNLRLELGHHLHPDPVRTVSRLLLLSHPLHHTPLLPLAMLLQPDGTLQCPAHQKLIPHEHRRETDGSLRIAYGASIHSCRPCPLREQCQWHGSATAKPRQVSVLLHPLVVGPAPLLWQDWSRREHRRACVQLVRDQQIEVRQAQSPPSQSSPGPTILSRAQRAHFRLSWTERVTRNASVSANGQVSLKLFGVPDQFADFLGLRAG